MISDKKKFVAIHINRTGGASREWVLGRYCRSLGGMRRHNKAFELCEILGPSLWESYFSFAFVRNPWDRMVSIYHHRRKALKITRSKRAQLPFGEWLRCEDTLDGTFGDQVQWLELDNKVIVNFVGRFESMERDWGEVCRRIGIRSSLPHMNKSVRKGSYHGYYDEGSRKFVAKLCVRDIELFSYRY